MNHTKHLRHRWGNALFGNALILGSLTLIALHKLSPTSIRFEGTMAGMYTLGGIAASLFLAAMFIHRSKDPTPEMDATWAPAGEFFGLERADFSFEANIKRDGVKLPVLVLCEWSGEYAYSVRIFEGAILAEHVRVGATEYPKGSTVLLTEDEENCFACDSAIEDEIKGAQDADDTKRDNDRERR